MQKIKDARRKAAERRAKRDEKRGYHIYWGKALRRALSLSLHFAARLLSYILNIIITVLVIGIITAMICGIVFVFYLKNNIDPTLDVDILRTEQDGTTMFFYIDEEGNEVELEDERIHGGENRIWVSVHDVPKHVIDAFVAIEDHRFWDHQGVDWYRTLGAVQNFLFSSGSFGGSTITQQLVKNITGDDEYSIQRKVQEMFRALYLEQKLDKTEILEYYLNTIYLSQGCYGIKTAAKTYFNKEVQELTLVEGAALASIIKYPTKYDPIQNPEYNLERRNTVLKTMLQYGKITEEEFEEAWDEPLDIYTPPKNTEEEKSTAHVSSDYIDAVIEDLIADIMEMNHVTREIASNLVFSSGYRVYICMDHKVQSILEECYKDDSIFPKQKKNSVIQPQSAMVVCDPYTGDCLGIIGRRGEKTQSRILCLATQAKRSPGSSIKPLSTYGPALDLGLITWGSVYDDMPVSKVNGKAWPQNVNFDNQGLVNIRYAVEQSLNTVAVKVMMKVTVERSYQYLLKLGIKNLVESYTNSRGMTMSDINIAPLALGATTIGLTVREMASAYTTFTNGGIHNKSRTYTKVLDSQGNVVIDNKLQGTLVFSASTCTLMTKLMEEVVQYHVRRNEMDITDYTACAGKTGTSMYEFDRWFCGFTPYYVGAVWYGYVENAPLDGGPNPSMFVFDRIMVRLHQDLYDKAKAEGTQLIQNFEQAGDIVTCLICKDSGQLYNPETCGRDERGGRSEVGYYVNGTQPTTYCSSHVILTYCSDSKKLANEYCPHTYEVCRVLNAERDYSLTSKVVDYYYVVRPSVLSYCQIHNELYEPPYDQEGEPY